MRRNTILLVILGFFVASFIALTIPGVLLIVRDCKNPGGASNLACRTGIIISAVACLCLILALICGLLAVFAKEAPAEVDASELPTQGVLGRPSLTAKVAHPQTQVVPFFPNAMEPAWAHPNCAPAPWPQAHHIGLPSAEYHGAVYRLQNSLTTSRHLLWGLLQPGSRYMAPANMAPARPPYEFTHPIPGKPYFDWDQMGSVLPYIHGGRYLRQEAVGPDQVSEPEEDPKDTGSLQPLETSAEGERHR